MISECLESIAVPLPCIYSTPLYGLLGQYPLAYQGLPHALRISLFWIRTSCVQVLERVLVFLALWLLSFPELPRTYLSFAHYRHGAGLDHKRLILLSEPRSQVSLYAPKKVDFQTSLREPKDAQTRCALRKKMI